MSATFSLAALNSGESAVIRTVHGDGAMYERLCDLGFTPGTSVTCLFASFLGDPRAYRVKDTIIALRRCNAEQVECLAAGGRA